MEVILAGIPALAAKYPVIVTILFVMGALRVIFKPIFSVLRAYVEFTPNPADNVVLDKVERSGVYKTVAWFLDYLASIKLAK